MVEDDVYIGDRWRIGTAEVQVTEPRLPCYKLGVRFGRADMVKRFLVSQRTGFYLAGVTPGCVEAAQSIELVHRPTHHVTIADITRVYAFDRDDSATMERIVHVTELSNGWRTYFQERLHDS